MDDVAADERIKYVVYWLYSLLLFLIIIWVYLDPDKLYVLVGALALALIIWLIVRNSGWFRRKMINLFVREFDYTKWMEIRRRASLIATILLPITLIIIEIGYHFNLPTDILILMFIPIILYGISASILIITTLLTASRSLIKLMIFINILLIPLFILLLTYLKG